MEWLRIYKIPAGKPANKFAFDGQAKDQEFVSRVIAETHAQWKKIVGTEIDSGNIVR